MKFKKTIENIKTGNLNLIYLILFLLFMFIISNFPAIPIPLTDKTFNLIPETFKYILRLFSYGSLFFILEYAIILLWVFIIKKVIKNIYNFLMIIRNLHYYLNKLDNILFNFFNELRDPFNKK